MGKEIVGNFNKDLSKIEFYEIVDNYKIYTIIRKQATDKYYLYDNKLGVLSEELDITELPEDKNEYDEILKEKKTWYYGVVFFWADSKFVTEYGAPYYHKLVDIYKEVCRHHSIPFCDLLGTCGIDGTNETEKAYYYADGIHPTNAGYYRIAQTLAGFLRGL